MIVPALAQMEFEEDSRGADLAKAHWDQLPA